MRRNPITSTRLATAVTASLLAAVLLTAVPLAAEESAPETSVGKLGGSGSGDGDSFGGSVSRPGQESPGTDAKPRGPRPNVQSNLLPVCDRQVGDTTGCTAQACGDGGTLMYEAIATYESPEDTTGALSFGDQRCVTTTESVYTAAQLQFFRAQPDLPAPGLSPKHGVTLVGVFPTLFWTSGDTQTNNYTLLGEQVQLSIIPTSYLWTFGNGKTMTTTYPGIPHDRNKHPLEKLRGETDPQKYRPYVIHRYERAGQTCHTTVSVTYRGQYSINGGDPTDIDGTITHTSPPRALATIEYRSQLEASPPPGPTETPKPIPSPPTDPNASTKQCVPTQR